MTRVNVLWEGDSCTKGTYKLKYIFSCFVQSYRLLCTQKSKEWCKIVRLRSLHQEDTFSSLLHQSSGIFVQCVGTKYLGDGLWQFWVGPIDFSI